MVLSKRKERLVRQELSNSRRMNSFFLGLLGFCLVLFSLIYFFDNLYYLLGGVFLGVIFMILGFRKKTDFGRFERGIKKRRIRLTRRDLRGLN
jgi:hypothetical protein